jgi:hypothetical protein
MPHHRSTARRRTNAVAALAAALAVGAGEVAAMAAEPRPVDQRYVLLALAVGEHDADYIDAYYGPPEWREEVRAAKRPLAAVREDAAALLAELQGQAPAAGELERLRQEYLRRQLQAMLARIDQLGGRKMRFDEESRALYDAVAPHHDESWFEKVVAELDPLLPGAGALHERFERFRRDFVIPRDRLDAVFRAAIDECRRRTVRRLALPEGESFTVEYVQGKSWSAYNWYKGGYRSVIQVNTDLPISIDRAIDLACHEGYPGHHVYNVLLEKSLVKDRGWREFTVYPLFSPQSLIAEGTANFGIEVAFPGGERLAFEKERLYPLAGLDASRADRYERVRRVVDKLSYAGNEAARRYLEGAIDAAAAARWLERYALMSPERARQRVRFFDQYRSYVINYNLGQDMVRRYVESRGGTADREDARWAEFARLLSSPRLPGGLVEPRRP